MANGNNVDMKVVLAQLNQWCRVNNISVQSVYDQCKGMTLQELVYYLFGVVRDAVDQFVVTQGEFDELYKFVHDYFDNLDVQEEINNVLNAWYESGAIAGIFNFKIAEITLPYTGVQGDCFIVKYNNKIIMVDSGYTGAQTAITAALNKYGNHVDYLIITHFDPDHVDGILNNYYNNYFNSNTVVFIGIHSTTGIEWYNNNITSVINILTGLGCQIHYCTESEVYNLGSGGNLVFNNTNENSAYDTSTESGLNDLSLITTLNIGNKSVLFTGDINKAAQIVNYPLLKKCYILAVPHHGGYYSINFDFLKTVSPDYAMACNTPATNPGYPTSGSYRQLYDNGCLTFTTNDTQKTFTIEIFVDGLKTDGKTWISNDILNNMFIDNTAQTTNTEITDEQILESLDTYRRMFASFAPNHLSNNNKYFLGDRVNNVIGFRGSTTQKTFMNFTIYDHFPILNYVSGGNEVTKSFAWCYIDYTIENGQIKTVNKRTISDMLILNEDNSFTINASRPIFISISSVDNTEVLNAASIFDSNNQTVARIGREANTESTNPVIMLFRDINTTYHLENITETNFVVRIVCL